MVFGIGGRNPEKYDQRALKYEQKGKTNKAQKNRNKAAQIRSGGTYNGPTNVYTGPTTAGQQGKGIGYGGLGAIPPHTSPQGVAGHPPIVAVFQNTPAGGLATKSAAPLGAVGVTGPTTVSTTTTTMPVQQQQQQVPLQQTTFIAPSSSGGNTLGQLYNYNSQRTPADYEARALKWENRGNFQKAQKNREKVWRSQNPTLPLSTNAPNFYSGGKFSGYGQNNFSGQNNLTQQQTTTTTTTMPIV